VAIEATGPVESIVDIRILPMSQEAKFAGEDLGVVQKRFFLGLLKERGGSYAYRRHRMAWNGGRILVLFQMKGKILGSAELEGVETYEVPREGLYHGEYRFDPETITMVEPIPLAEFRKVVPEIVAFNQARQKIPLHRLGALRAFFQDRSSVE